VFRRVARAIPLDAQYGGELACTSNYKLRENSDPRFTDRRMQLLLTNLTMSLHEMSLAQLVHILYSAVKLRIPEDQLIGGCIELITDKLANDK
jgi:hypothetical protein